MAKGIIGKSQSVLPVGLLNSTSISITNLSGSLVTSAVKTAIVPLAGSWMLELLKDSNDSTLIVVTALDNINTVQRVSYVATTYTDLLISGLEIVIAGSQPVGSKSIITVNDVAQVGAVVGDTNMNAIFVGNAMKVVQIRANADAEIVTTITLAVVDCRGFNGISFHANLTSAGGTGGTIQFVGGLDNDASKLAQCVSFVNGGVFPGNLAAGRNSSAALGISQLYHTIKIFGDAINKCKGDFWAILHSNSSGQPNRAA